MIRKLAALLVVAAIAAAALFLADRPGTIALDWQGWRIETSLAVLVLALALAGFVLWLVLGTLTRLIGAPARLARSRREARRLQAYRMLTDGLVAIAAGDASAADKLRHRAEALFARTHHDTPPLTRLIAAQSALLKGDAGAAKAEFTAMLDSPDTEFLGLRGLIAQALKTGDDATALRLTERANRLRPATSWVLQSQLALETRAGDWRRAHETLREAIKRKAVTAEQGRHYDVTLLLARSRQAQSDGRHRDALAFATRAVRLDRDFAPAAIQHARLLGEGRHLKRGIKMLETAWAGSGHPALADAYGKLFAGDAPHLRLQRAERLVDLRPGDPYAHLAAAAVALDTRLWGEARRHLDTAGAAKAGPWPAKLCRLMADLEEGERQDMAAARRWLERAAVAPPDPSWGCTACGHEATDWSPLCPACHGFDTLKWGAPDRATAASHAELDVLSPLAVDTVALDLAPPQPGRTSAARAATAGAAAEAALRAGG